MKFLITTLILSVMFLSAGAIAGANRSVSWQVPETAENVTVIRKNQAWPRAGWISVEPCNMRRCIGV